MSERRLVSIRRAVEPASEPAYLELWQRLKTEANRLGAHAWRFRSTSDATAQLEFLEFRDGADPRSEPAVAGALRDLESLAQADAVEEWLGG
jgi:hypothetical protein